MAPKETIFLPGRVLDRRGNQLKVKFVDGIIDENVYYNDCYWLSRDYYQDACNFYKRELDTSDELNQDDYNFDTVDTIKSQQEKTKLIDAKNF